MQMYHEKLARPCNMYLRAKLRWDGKRDQQHTKRGRHGFDPMIQLETAMTQCYDTSHDLILCQNFAVEEMQQWHVLKSNHCKHKTPGERKGDDISVPVILSSCQVEAWVEMTSNIMKKNEWKYNSLGKTNSDNTQLKVKSKKYVW